MMRKRLMNPVSKRQPARRSAAVGRWRRRGEDGTSLVELAFALPLLLLIMLGTIDMGRLYFDYIKLRSAVVDGATYAARNPSDTPGAVAETLGTGVPPGTTAAVSFPSGNCSTRGGNGKVTVSATSTFTPVTTGFLSRFGLGPVTLTATSTMRCMT